MQLTSTSKLLLNDALQFLIHLASNLDSLSDGLGPNRSDHELLECHAISRMRTAIQNVEKGHRKHVSIGRRTCLLS